MWSNVLEDERANVSSDGESISDGELSKSSEDESDELLDEHRELVQDIFAAMDSAEYLTHFERNLLNDSSFREEQPDLHQRLTKIRDIGRERERKIRLTTHDEATVDNEQCIIVHYCMNYWHKHPELDPIDDTSEDVKDVFDPTNASITREFRERRRVWLQSHVLY